MSDNVTSASAITTFPDLDFELANTRRILERVPEDKWTWRPHEKSMTLARKATHLVEVMKVATSTVSDAKFDLAGEARPDAASKEDLLRQFDAQSEALSSAVRAAQPQSWADTWQLVRGEMVLRSMPRAVALRIAGLNHLVHHRGQLSVYLRLLEVPVPGLYGPSADER